MPEFEILPVLIDLLFPRRCPVCDDIVMPKGALICSSCIKKLSYVKSPACKKCGKEVLNDTVEYCFDCTKHKRSFSWGRALINYDDTAKNSMARIKYQNKREYLDFYSQAICKRYGVLIGRMNADALVPVPVHPSRLRQRGFNQAAVLAEKIGRITGIPVGSCYLCRTKKTAPQKQLGPAERLKNLEEAFAVENMEGTGKFPLKGKRLILIDDIYTTGSTIEACTRVLKRAGAEEVFFFTISIGRGQ